MTTILNLFLDTLHQSETSAMLNAVGAYKLLQRFLEMSDQLSFVPRTLGNSARQLVVQV